MTELKPQGFSRRDFLKWAAAAGAGVVVGPAVDTLLGKTNKAEASPQSQEDSFTPEIKAKAENVQVAPQENFWFDQVAGTGNFLVTAQARIRNEGSTTYQYVPLNQKEVDNTGLSTLFEPAETDQQMKFRSGIMEELKQALNPGSGAKDNYLLLYYCELTSIGDGKQLMKLYARTMREKKGENNEITKTEEFIPLFVTTSKTLGGKWQIDGMHSGFDPSLPQALEKAETDEIISEKSRPPYGSTANIMTHSDGQGNMAMGQNITLNDASGDKKWGGAVVWRINKQNNKLEPLDAENDRHLNRVVALPQGETLAYYDDGAVIYSTDGDKYEIPIETPRGEYKGIKVGSDGHLYVLRMTKDDRKQVIINRANPANPSNEKTVLTINPRSPGSYIDIDSYHREPGFALVNQLRFASIDEKKTVVLFGGIYERTDGREKAADIGLAILDQNGRAEQQSFAHIDPKDLEDALTAYKQRTGDKHRGSGGLTRVEHWAFNYIPGGITIRGPQTGQPLQMSVYLEDQSFYGYNAVSHASFDRLFFGPFALTSQ